MATEKSKNFSRRDLCRLLPTLAASGLFAAEGASLPSKAFRFEDLPVRADGQNRFRSILEGRTHAGCAIEVHESDLAPGAMPHPPHHHVHEEMFLIREGTVEVTIASLTTRLGPGSATFVASNDEHSIRNVGESHAQYFVVALGTDS